VTFSGVPTEISSGEVLFEYAKQKFRPLAVENGAFSDRLGPFDAHVYRFPAASQP
jgi:hypothetical protein